MQSWRELLPDYEIKEWNESNFDFSDCEYAVQAYNEKKYGFVSDYIRLAVLQKYGGIYLDTDIAVLRSFDDLLSHEMFLSFENNAYVQTAVIGSEPNHPFLDLLLEYYRSRSFICKNKNDLTPNTIYLTYFLRKRLNMKFQSETQVLQCGDRTVTVLNRCCLAPIDYTTNIISITEETHTIHLFAGSWTESQSKVRDKVLRGVRYLFGKRIFAAFTKMYVLSCCRSLDRQCKKLQRNAESTKKIQNKTI